MRTHKAGDDESDKDYLPPEENAYDTEDEDKGEDDGLDMADELLEELAPGDIEVTDISGKIEIYRSAQPLSAEEEASKDNSTIVAARKDSRFEDNTNKRKILFNDIMSRAKASSADRFQIVLDFTDDWKGIGKVPKKNSEIIQCNKGGYIQTGKALNGSAQLRQLTEDEIKQMDSSDSQLCYCKICKKRRENDVFTKPAPGLRNGNKRGWEKYGEGRKL
ncbi:hypothetical protein B7494_g8123 [Chlorociboria aeruginascens]|nr:hypothetical protein B7494_g8123 [Chlorociboria aeruginascens]